MSSILQMKKTQAKRRSLIEQGRKTNFIKTFAFFLPICDDFEVNNLAAMEKFAQLIEDKSVCNQNSKKLFLFNRRTAKSTGENQEFILQPHKKLRANIYFFTISVTYYTLSVPQFPTQHRPQCLNNKYSVRSSKCHTEL